MAIWNKLFGGNQGHTDDSIPLMLERIENGKAVLLDVRSHEERNAGHVKDSFFVPFDEVQSLTESSEQLAFLPKDKIIYCH